MAKPGEPLRFFEEVVRGHEADDCLVWPYSRTSAGYGKFYYNGKLTGVHRAICEIEHGPPPTPRHEAAHSCGKGHEGCCAKKHLSWKTPKQNTDDQITHGTRRLGERHANSKLTEDDVRQIRAMQGTATQREIAAIFNTSEGNVGVILRRRNWRWLK